MTTKDWYVHHFGKTWHMSNAKFEEFCRERARDCSVQPDKYGEEANINVVTLRDLDDIIDVLIDEHNNMIEERKKSR